MGFVYLLVRVVIPAFLTSVLLTGMVWLGDKLVRKIKPEWGPKIDKFWEIF